MLSGPMTPEEEDLHTIEILQPDPVGDRSQVVAQMQRACGLNA